MRVPSDAEINATAERLGMPAVTPRERAKVAKACQLAPQIDDAERASEVSTADFAASIAAAHTGLLDAGLPEHAAALVAAAIAPDVWRKTQGAAHARR
ncbi:hypothetical protein C8K38_111198 [Rhodococcus sp. OK611]|uniref:hypothetical protein n=1 Tax=unclassified Rhodococcus (in: high G+C Gram-positive bacteria) TaxID=192944 RepID=UPI000BD19783|nr:MULTISPECIES: hypothetical protein [unclassified Rhodococcus (in: high G+C Gram-positive bacteria)]PTR42029.1 hypothetical protein C8K38_111198 [Rhodococcus sp. OK611]SNX91524.1 hypothetical protein SAMN05447004_11059 [Rhodococcus sp. OK270]